MSDDKMTLNKLVEMSVTIQDPLNVVCEIPLNIEGETWLAYECDVSYRDLLFHCDKGVVTYLVDSYGDKHIAVLHDWESDND